MLHSVKCDRPFFKTVEFSAGFNVILAERTQQATKRDSRNGLGKSTLIEIIHFCLGGNKGETLKKPALDDWTFSLDLDLKGNRYVVSRNTKDMNKVFIDGECIDWVLEPEFDPESKKKVLSKDDWNTVLGNLIFGLQPVNEYKYSPTFRSLISYFARKNGQSGAFLSPFKQFGQQLEWDKQVNNAYLLGLGWEFASKLQVLKDRGKLLNEIKKELKEINPEATNEVSNVMGTTGELEARKIRLQDQVEQEKKQLDTFKVHPQYNKLEENANELTAEIHEMVNKNITDRRLVDYYKDSLKEETDAHPEKINNLYEEAGLVFPQQVKKSITDVLLFHKNIVSNRKAYLNLEIEKINHNITRREELIVEKTSQRAELLLSLKDRGALQEWTQLQNNHQKTVADLNDVSTKLENLKHFEQGKSSINVEQELLYQQAKNDLNERKSQKEQAILTFNSYIDTLYSASGFLSIDFEKTGFKYNISIERSGSHGIGCMKIFCYDLMLAKIWSKKAQIFLIHDSILFGDVDERQKALALQLAASESEKEGFQYICTMNSDGVPRKDFDEKFFFDKYVIKTFTDTSESGGLLGMRF